MLRDERFTSQAKVDRYGRSLKSNKGRKELERLYRVEKTPSPTTGILAESEIEADDDDDVLAELARVRKNYDPARDGGFDESSSDESSSDDDYNEAQEEDAEFLDRRATDAPVGEVSARLAVVNLDWDNIRAMDLLAVFSSFVPTGGRILKVSVYPSEFGKERMERENLEGPPKEIFAKRKSHDGTEPDSRDSSPRKVEDEDDDDEDERIQQSIVTEDRGEEYNSTLLRRYQIERLRYYYAVLSCSSPACAKEIYDAVDGCEYLSSANFFDLRFIPDDMDFTEDSPRDECEQIPDRYRPNEFVTGALQHSKVKLSWDADDTQRKEIQRKAFSGSRAEIEENDLKAYLASDSSEDDASSVKGDAGDASAEKQTKKEQERQRMRALLGLTADPSKSKSEDKGPVGDMQITFSAGLAEDKAGPVFENHPEGGETTIEKYARMEKERKARRTEKRKANIEGHHAESVSNEAGKEPAADLGFDDPFFAAPEQARASAVALKKESKRKQRVERQAEDERAAAQRAELELLVADDENAGNLVHFDMQDLEKGEKVLRKGKKPKNLSKNQQQAVAAKQADAFVIDVADPRFAAIYDRHEFAVDPSHPRFHGTEGMQTLLQEYRRKRTQEIPDEVEKAARKKAKKGRAEATTRDKENLGALLKSVKTKSKR